MARHFEILEVTREWEANCREWWKPVSEWECPANSGSVTKTIGVSATFGWCIAVGGKISPQDAFAGLNASCGYQFSETYTVSEIRSFTLRPGVEQRLVYIPNLHRKTGYARITEDYDHYMDTAGGLVAVQHNRVISDREYFDAAFPGPGGTYELQEWSSEAEVRQPDRCYVASIGDAANSFLSRSRPIARPWSAPAACLTRERRA